MWSSDVVLFFMALAAFVVAVDRPHRVAHVGSEQNVIDRANELRSTEAGWAL
jgi:hypothetical protein